MNSCASDESGINCRVGAICRHLWVTGIWQPIWHQCSLSSTASLCRESSSRYSTGLTGHVLVSFFSLVLLGFCAVPSARKGSQLLTYNGKQFNADEFSHSLEKAAVESVIAQVREKFGSIRHPATGEFPTIFATGDSLKTLSMRVEGSAELLAIVKERYIGDDLPLEFVTTGTTAPKVFLSYAWENRILAEKIAIALQSNGIDTWWAEWCISAGDSLRQKIDAGLSECTHFVVLLTPESIQKPWVNQEMDAGLVRRLTQKAKFIPLRHGLEPALLPALLTGMLSPDVDAEASNIQQLINDIHGLTRKPPLGQAPMQATSAAEAETGYSVAANAIAEVFVKGSSGGRLLDPQVRVEDMMKKTGLSAEDIVDAMHELSSFAVLHRGEITWPKEQLFSEFDKFWMSWDPARDALQLAADIVNIEGFPDSTEDIAAHYGWEARRLNPAITYLATRGAVQTLAVFGVPWVSGWVKKTDAMRRFVKSRS